jgi:hypothetical protein
MQVKKTPGALRLGLMAASCSLLGARAFADAPASAAPAETAADDEQPWQFDTGLLYFKENQGRVNSTSPLVSLRKDLGGERVYSGSLQFATFSGSSPNGALPSRKLQTFATASGTRLNNPDGTPITYTTPSGQLVAQLATLTLYQVEPYRLPSDPHYHEQRTTLDSGWSQPIAAGTHVNVGGRLSNDSDCLALGATGGLSHDFNNKATTIGVDGSFESDRVKPPGGTPVPGSDFRLTNKIGGKGKWASGAMASLTQVVSSHWIANLNYAYEHQHGYLNNPYKILSVVDATGAATDYRFERRPARRTLQTVYFGNKVALGPTVLDLSFRHGKDDWGVKADSAEAKLRFNVGSEDIYLEPHLRWYHQGQADFYRLFVSAGQPLPAYLSPDTNLAAFVAHTVGLKLGFLLQDKAELTFRLDVYTQSPKYRSSGLTNLQGLDLNPSLRTVLFQVGWRHGF